MIRQKQQQEEQEQQSSSSSSRSSSSSSVTVDLLLNSQSKSIQPKREVCIEAHADDACVGQPLRRNREERAAPRAETMHACVHITCASHSGHMPLADVHVRNCSPRIP